MLSITNTLSLVLQADKKYFGAIQRVMNSTITILMVMASNQNTIHLKSFNGQNEVLMKMNTHTDCNIVLKVLARGLGLSLVLKQTNYI